MKKYMNKQKFFVLLVAFYFLSTFVVGFGKGRNIFAQTGKTLQKNTTFSLLQFPELKPCKGIFCYANASTGEQIPYKTLANLLNKVPGNEDFLKKEKIYKNILYAGLGIMGASALLYFLGAPLADYVSSDSALLGVFITSVSTASIGLILTVTGGALLGSNRHRTIEKYRIYGLGLRKRF